MLLVAHVAKYQAGALGNMCGHYDRWNGDLSKAQGRKNIDPTLSHLNYNLAPPRSSQIEFINQRISELELKKAPRKDAVRICDCVITAPKNLEKNQHRKFFRAAYRALSERYGAENVISSWVHLDEPNAQPHMHFAWVPVTKDGRLSAKTVVNRNDLRTLHRDLQTQISKKFGYTVDVLLPDNEKAVKELSRLNHQDYEKVTAELAQTRSELAETYEVMEKLENLYENVEKLVSVNTELKETIKSLHEQLEKLVV